MPTSAIEDVVSGLQRARDEQAHRVALENAKLEQLELALRQLQDTILVVDPENLPRKDFTGLGIVEAARRWLAEIGEEKTTAEIAREILTRGVTTKSKNFVPTVYATLANSKQFSRHGDKWKLR